MNKPSSGDWWGCEKVSPACQFCYAAEYDRFRGGGESHWGGQAPRLFIKGADAAVRKWNRAAARDGVRRKVFASSMCDIFEDHDGPVVDRENDVYRMCDCGWGGLLPVIQRQFGPQKKSDDCPECGDETEPMALEWIRKRLIWPAIRDCQNLIFLLLTKRPENIKRMLPADLRPADNVWLGCTVESREYLPRLDHLLSVPAALHFCSCEPQLEEIDFRPWLERLPICEIDEYGPAETGRFRAALRWIITGGESKQGADHVPRPYDLAWPRSIIRQCREAGAAAFVKQLGSSPFDSFYRSGVADQRVLLKHSKGEDPAEWPADLRVQEFPETAGARR